MDSYRYRQEVCIKMKTNQEKRGENKGKRLATNGRIKYGASLMQWGGGNIFPERGGFGFKKGGNPLPRTSNRSHLKGQEC